LQAAEVSDFNLSSFEIKFIYYRTINQDKTLEFLQEIISFIMHVDVHLRAMIDTYGTWTYAILFFIIFAETGLVVTPFLPGDSLLFAAGALSASTSLDPVWLFIILSIAAIVGNITNYWIGYYVGPGILRKGSVRFIRKEYLERTHRFYEKHGGITIVFARFIPIIRTFAPFVAGLGFMSYGRFMFFNVVAGMAWVGVFIFGGYYFGNIPAVKDNFTIVIAAIIIISLIPPVVEALRQRKHITSGDADKGKGSNG
jgi:membrane-associated protein